MYTIIITVIVTVAIYAILVVKKVVKKFNVYVLNLFVIGSMEIGALIAACIPQTYVISEHKVYYILDKPINIQSRSDEITFFTEGVYGEPIQMVLKVDSLLIEHTNDGKSQIEVTTYVRTNKFAIGGPKVKANVFMSSNPHH